MPINWYKAWNSTMIKDITVTVTFTNSLRIVFDFQVFLKNELFEK